jgi:hypothetical protein
MNKKPHIKRGVIMNALISPKKRCLLIGVGLILVVTITVLSYAKGSPTSSLSIEPVYAIYKQRDTGDFFKIVLAIVNSGKEEVTVVTEHLDCGFLGIDKDSNSLRCVLSFDAEIKYKNEYLTVPSIYKYAPVTLKQGEVAIVNCYQDYSKALNAKSMSEKNIEADNIVITYKVSPFWAKRFSLWHGELQSSPIEFRKVVY